MTVTVDSLLVGPPSGTLDAALDALGQQNAEYLTEMWRVATAVGLDPGIIAAQFHLETNGAQSPRWIQNRNPAGLGIEADSDADPATLTQTDAAQLHIWCMVFTVTKPLSTLFNLPRSTRAFTTRWMRKIEERNYPHPVVTIADLQKRYVDSTGEPQSVWAWDDQYATKLVARHRAIFGAGEETVGTKPHILVNAGHRNTTGGNDIEREMTDDLARAYRDAFRAAGYVCDWLQEIDGDADPDDTLAGLDMVSRKMAAWIASQPGQCVLFDLHSEGTAPSVRGCFAIIPDVTGLTTGAPVPQDPSDTWENNKLDRKLARQLVDSLSLRTGIPLRTGIREPGLMDESETGVGGQGYRLATFAYTSPQRSKCVRLVVEHGAHTNSQDMAIIQSPGFFQKCADSALDAVRNVYGSATPEQPTAAPIWWEPGDIGPQRRASDGALALAMLGEVMAKRDVPIRVSANSKSPILKTLKQGEKIKLVGTGRYASRWNFVEVSPGVYGRALWSAFVERFPTL